MFITGLCKILLFFLQHVQEVKKNVGLQYNVLGREYPSINCGQTTECLLNVAACSSAGVKITEQRKYLNAASKFKLATGGKEFHLDLTFKLATVGKEFHLDLTFICPCMANVKSKLLPTRCNVS